MEFSDKDPWARAIYDSTACLRTQPQQRREQNRNGSGGDSHPTASMLHSMDTSLAFLDMLEIQLLKPMQNAEDEAWSHPPAYDPPHWPKFSKTYARDPARAMNEAQVAAQDDPKYDDCEDDDAGDVPSAFYTQDNNRMDGRRLLIRILTCQSELFAGKALVYSSKDCKQFQEGASQLQLALGKIHQALHVADAQICKWWIFMDTAPAPSTSAKAKLTHEKDKLVQDATVVEVAIQSMTQRREKLLELCHHEENWLLRMLQPQWEDRDQVKQRMGEDRWTNNPNPKRDYAKQRREYEARLRIVRRAMEALQDLDAESALEKVSEMQAQLQSGARRPFSSGNENASSQNDIAGSTDDDLRQQRYNGLRPSQQWALRRVDVQQYPDPTTFGWTFTGSWQAVEFFERKVQDKIVKLDWYFTTATIKTSLDHPKQGKTQLFAKPVSPGQYKEILRNPRTHTGKRYQKRQNRGGQRNKGNQSRGNES
jgi:hypothetical protein